ncbi:beaten path VI [Carabus blaptoides fortunei]
MSRLEKQRKNEETEKLNTNENSREIQASFGYKVRTAGGDMLITLDPHQVLCGSDLTMKLFDAQSFVTIVTANYAIIYRKRMTKDGRQTVQVFLSGRQQRRWTILDETVVSRSDSREVTLRDVQRELTGFYKCEVSADAPLFHTDIKSAYMMIADIPEEGPTISAEVRKVAIGAKVKANCTAPAAYPSVNLTWYANGEQLRPGDGVHISSSVSRYGQLFPGLESAVSRLEADAKPELFRDGRLRLRCLATMFTLYRKTDETEIVEDTPRLALVVGPTQPHTTFQEGDSSGTELIIASELHLLAAVCTTALVSIAMR